LNEGLGVPAELSSRWWDDVASRYCEGGRAYHTLAHLIELFSYFDAEKFSDPEAVALAIFFHDAIYNPRAGTPKNEIDSADLFERYGQECLPAGSPPGLRKGQLIGKVRRWIIQTASHAVSEEDDEDCKLFLDMDMAVLGRPWEEYEAYSRQIRVEYAHVPAAIFYKARSEFLVKAAEGPTIFASEKFLRSKEKQARENMTREGKELQERYEGSGILQKTVAAVVLSSDLKAYGSLFGKGSGVAIAVAGAALAPKAAAGALAAASTAAGLFGLRLAFGASYLRFPYPEPASKSKVAVLAGSFNPPHLGHLAMLEYLSKAHTKVYAVIGVNPNKTYAVNPYQRQELLRAMLEERGLSNVEVVVYGGIIFHFAREVKASVMYRGIRTWKEDGRAEKYLEFQNLFYQMVLGRWPIPTAYLQGDPDLCTVSSTLLRSRLKEGSKIDDLVPAGTAKAIIQAYGQPQASL